jgi:hypothetical protein
MDSNGARHLVARLAIGVPVGSRFEVVDVGDRRSPLSPGDTGTLISVDGASARLRVDDHGELEIDPHSVTLRRLLRQSA